jgi:MFS family permease
VTGVAPHWPLAIVCWLLSGVLAAYIIEATTVVIQAIPEDRRARLVGTLGALLLSAQGAGLLLFGLATQVINPAHSIGLAGLIGSACALALALGPLRQSPAYQAAHRVGSLPSAQADRLQPAARGGVMSDRENYRARSHH